MDISDTHRCAILADKFDAKIRVAARVAAGDHDPGSVISNIWNELYEYITSSKHQMLKQLPTLSPTRPWPAVRIHFGSCWTHTHTHFVFAGKTDLLPVSQRWDNFEHLWQFSRLVCFEKFAHTLVYSCNFFGDGLHFPFVFLLALTFASLR